MTDDASAKCARLAVLISGGGRTLINLAERIKAGDLDATIALVIASQDCAGVERARDKGMHVVVLKDELEDARFRALLDEHAIDWIVLAGYLRLAPVPAGYEGRMVNIHPALLPDFGGEGMYGERVHQAVIASGARTSGCTVHLCDNRYDEGPIVLQKTCEVRIDDTPGSLAARVFSLECEALPEALSQLIAGRNEFTEDGADIAPTRSRP